MKPIKYRFVSYHFSCGIGPTIEQWFLIPEDKMKDFYSYVQETCEKQKFKELDKYFKSCEISHPSSYIFENPKVL